MYKVKSHSKRIPRGYFQEREYEAIRKKYKGKRPPFFVIGREALRNVSGTIEKTHEKGNFVKYKGELAVIKKVERRGVWIIPIKSGDKGEIFEEEKPIFVSEKDIEAGKLTSTTSNVPVIFSNIPFQL